jgi:hypothetical protein
MKQLSFEFEGVGCSGVAEQLFLVEYNSKISTAFISSMKSKKISFKKLADDMGWSVYWARKVCRRPILVPFEDVFSAARYLNANVKFVLN